MACSVPFTSRRGPHTLHPNYRIVRTYTSNKTSQRGGCHHPLTFKKEVNQPKHLLPFSNYHCNITVSPARQSKTTPKYLNSDTTSNTMSPRATYSPTLTLSACSPLWLTNNLDLSTLIVSPLSLQNYLKSAKIERKEATVDANSATSSAKSRINNYTDSSEIKYSRCYLLHAPSPIYSLIYFDT